MSQKSSGCGRDTFSGVKIHYIGGIEDTQKGESITGSCSLFRAQDTQGNKVDVVIDFGTHQSGKKAQELNESIDPRIVDADYLIITHAHLDHIGRLPMLVKSGFRGKIFMTNYTRSLAEHSLYDAAKIMQREYEETIRRNKQKRAKYQDALRYLSAKKRIQENNFRKKGQKEGLKNKMSEIEKRYGDELHETITKIKQYDINSSEKIEEILRKEHRPLFSQADVEALFEKGRFIHVLEEGAFTHLQLTSHKGAKDVKNKPQIEHIVLGFLDAGHIIGSVQAQISIKTKQLLAKSEQVEGITQMSEKEHRFLFSGDLGRTDARNYAGNPTLPEGKYRYAQVESTYAGRNHPEREASIEALYQAIAGAKGNILIPAFSIQRTQDILLLLLEYYETNILPQKKQIREKLKEMKADYEAENKSLEMDRAYYELCEEGKQRLDSLDFQIVCDSNLGSIATRIYADSFGGPYRSLSEEAQKEKYGEVLIHWEDPQSAEQFSREAYQKNGTGKQQHTTPKMKKRIFVSSGGMCEGGPVVNHLKSMISDANSTIIFVGYTPPNALGGRIKTEETVLIEGQAYKVYANIHDIAGFSGHAGEKTLLEYVSCFKTDTVIALTHGGDARYKMRTKMKKPRRGEIILPQNGDTISLDF